MLLDKLTLHNFCIYRDTQVIEMLPRTCKDREQNVILVGGMNGGGKTTILDAVQLALYGKRAQCSKRNETVYEDFLANCIHRDASPEEGASITLSFIFSSEGNENRYEVTRSWKRTRKAIKELVEVKKDEVSDSWLSKNWAQIVEEILPFGIAQICFFDAEKIRLLADDESSAQILGESIKSLLGLDLAQRLIVDCTALRSRILAQSHDVPEAHQIVEIEKRQYHINQDIESLVLELGGLENERLILSKQLGELERNFASIGGEHWKRREELQHQRGILEQELRQTKAQLINISFSELPLSLVESTLKKILEMATQEKKGHEIKQSLSVLTDHDKRLLRFLKTKSVPDQYIKVIRGHLEEERKTLSDNANVKGVISIPSRGYQMLSHSIEHGLPRQKTTAGKLIEEYHDKAEALADTLRNLAVVPDDSKVQHTLEKLKDVSMKISSCVGKMAGIEKLLESQRQERNDLEKKLIQLHNMAVSADSKYEENLRVIERINQTREVMEQYLSCMIVKKIEKLSENVTGALHRLLRKKSLIHKVVIDPKNFEIQFVGKNNEPILKQSLSEGEKQIFAISVLWGLAQSSPRPLPMIIDTPMARLDSIHRKRLVEQYFPHASHQVIVLSTDTEIEPHLLQTLKKHVSHSYFLNYSEERKVTTVDRGFFWEWENRKNQT